MSGWGGGVGGGVGVGVGGVGGGGVGGAGGGAWKIQGYLWGHCSAEFSSNTHGYA